MKWIIVVMVVLVCMALIYKQDKPKSDEIKIPLSFIAEQKVILDAIENEPQEKPIQSFTRPLSPAELCNDSGGEWAGKNCFSKGEKKVVYECVLCAPGTESNIVNGWSYPPNWSCGKCEPIRIDTPKPI